MNTEYSGGAPETENAGPLLPQLLKALGFGNLVVGPLLALVNLLVVGQSISRLERMNAPPEVSTSLEINIGIFFLLATLFVIGGIGLLRNRKWGRIWSFIAAVFCFVTLLAVSIVTNVTEALLRTGAIPLRPGQSFAFKGVAGVMAFAPLYGILVIVLLMLPDARAWARGQRLGGSGNPDQVAGDGVALVTRPTSGLAIASLVCSFIPFALLTQIAGLTLGIVALVKIKRSNGKLGGKGFAIAGVAISSAILLFIGGVLLVILFSGGFRSGSAPPSNTLAPSTSQNNSIRAEIYPNDTAHQGDQTIMSGTVRNISGEKLTGLWVDFVLSFKSGRSVHQVASVHPNELAPQEQGSYSFSFPTALYTGTSLETLVGEPYSTRIRSVTLPRSAAGK
jgi:hypothetical protein